MCQNFTFYLSSTTASFRWYLLRISAPVGVSGRWSKWEAYPSYSIGRWGEQCGLGFGSGGVSGDCKSWDVACNNFNCPHPMFPLSLKAALSANKCKSEAAPVLQYASYYYYYFYYCWRRKTVFVFVLPVKWTRGRRNWGLFSNSLLHAWRGRVQAAFPNQRLTSVTLDCF